MPVRYRMQAKSSTSGEIIPWGPLDAPDWAGESFPGPGDPLHIAAVKHATPDNDAGPLPPHRMPLDADCLMRWTFEESAAPFVNDGTLGSAQNMVAVSGEGVSWAGGQPDRLFGKALKFSMETTVSGAIRAPHFAWPTTAITVAVWVTVTRFVGSGSVGRIFFKAHDPSSWSSPFYRMTMQYASTGALSVGLRQADATLRTYTHNADYGLVRLYTPHLVGCTYDASFRRTYLDGYLVNSVAADAGALALGTGPWCIGDSLAPAAEHAGMILHEVRVDQVVRDAAWWLENWNRGKGRWLG